MIRGKLHLSPGQWAQVRRIYDETLDEPQDRRAEAALRLCEGDSQLESAIGQLLDPAARGSLGASRSFLDQASGEWLLPPVNCRSALI